MGEQRQRYNEEFKRQAVSLVLGTLEDAYEAKSPSKRLIHHSGRGTQYASKAYRSKLASYDMKASMSRRGNCYDIACIESFHSILKKELGYLSPVRFAQQLSTFKKCPSMDHSPAYIELAFSCSV
ncbi:DDE-type integrase/transposase/recombinase [Paenibacillus sp. L3-i20]|uniref:DDE-type integrase/transposase/recombinase n=1 Tax=Paenibacillus sp. L3-i20 TaxID=2905833 RepID=UPI00208666E8|nr:hypothetical protein L3i20_v226200 [Paenibacillus sp. L3-i20]